MEDTMEIQEQIEDCEAKADKAIANDFPGDAIAFEIRALRLQLQEITTAITNIAIAVYDSPRQ
jgi:hypothetical protein